MLKLSARSEYAILLVKYLVDHPGIISLESVSTELGIPCPILRKVSQRLVARGVCLSRKWRNGGVSLADGNPSLYGVLFAMDEDMNVALCTQWNPCNQENDCRISPILKRFQRWMESLLKITKI